MSATATTTPGQAAQRFAALERANDVRSRRAALKRDLMSGRQRVADVLADPPWFVASMRVADLLLAVPKVGRVKCGKLLGECRLPQSRKVGVLTDRQRAELTAALRGGGR